MTKSKNKNKNFNQGGFANQRQAKMQWTNNSTNQKNNNRGGIASFTLPEKVRIKLKKILDDFRESAEAELALSPDLDNIERKYLHELARKYGFKSKSRCSGPNRYITISKTVKAASAIEIVHAPALPITDAQTQIMGNYFYQCPIQIEELQNLANGAGREDRSLFKPVNTRQQKRKPALNSHQLLERQRRHNELQQAKMRNPQFKTALERRKKLPSWSFQSDVVELVKSQAVVLVAGETGCGKSTQVPQFLLDDLEIGSTCRIVCTQPRRISAISIAERIAEERGEQVGQMIGYTIRMDSETSASTQLNFVTPGILLRQLQSDCELQEYTHIIIDEVHERDKSSEFLLIVLRDLIHGPRAQNLKIILMSATLQTSKYADYFGNCPVITIGSQIYPVQEFYLEDILIQTSYLENAMETSSGLTDLFGLPTILANYTCVLCQRHDLKSPEEFGTHAAFCGVDVDQEVCLRKIMSARQASAKKIKRPQPHKEAAPEPWTQVQQTPDETEDSEVFEKWDGASPFIFKTQTANMAVDQLLQQYQISFDDALVDYDLILAILSYICKSAYEDGAVLIFLPGWDDITRMRNLLRQTPPYNFSNKFIIHALHSGVPSSEQRLVFKRPPAGARKIILSTNIAETSITIDDVSFVIDSGRVKEKSYDVHLKISTLESVWISKASCIQRKGRAGRVRAGVCFHLFSRHRHQSMKEVQESELLRTPLEEVCLQAKSLGFSEGPGAIATFLDKAVDAPHPKAVSNAIELLQAIGAFDESENMTELGQRLCSIAIEPRICKMVLWATLLGCADPALKIGCAISYRDPFVLPYNEEQKKFARAAKMELSLGMESDLIALLRCVQGWNLAIQKNGGVRAGYQFADQNFLMGSSLTMIADVDIQLSKELQRHGYPNPQSNGWWNANSKRLGFVNAIVAAGLYPNIGMRKAGEGNFGTKGGQKGKINQSSVNAPKSQRLGRLCEVEQELIAFGELSRSSSAFLLSCTCPLEPLALCLLVGSLETKGTEQYMFDEFENEEDEGDGIATFTLDEWLSFSLPDESAIQLQILRLRLHVVFSNFVRMPKQAISPSDRILLSTVSSLLDSNKGKQQQTTHSQSQHPNSTTSFQQHNTAAYTGQSFHYNPNSNQGNKTFKHSRNPQNNNWNSKKKQKNSYSWNRNK